MNLNLMLVQIDVDFDCVRFNCMKNFVNVNEKFEFCIVKSLFEIFLYSKYDENLLCNWKILLLKLNNLLALKK